MIREELTRGIFRENPAFVQMLGLCPLLAASTSLHSALGMGLAVSFVLVCSNVVIAAGAPYIPRRVRVPCYIVIVAAFVTVVQLVLQARFPQLKESLGIYVPLIVVNCIVLGRAQAFASRNGPGSSLLDGIAMGCGFTAALCTVAVVREALGSNSLWGAPLAPHVPPIGIFALAPGAFFAVAAILAVVNYLRRGRKAGTP